MLSLFFCRAGDCGPSPSGGVRWACEEPEGTEVELAGRARTPSRQDNGSGHEMCSVTVGLTLVPPPEIRVSLCSGTYRAPFRYPGGVSAL